MNGDIEVINTHSHQTKNRNCKSNNLDVWWENNVSEQFPIRFSKGSNCSIDVEVGKPHKGCIMRTTIINSKMNGESSIFSERNVLMATLTFVDGVASGPCKLYDDGYLFFVGRFVNGYREGRGKEYDRNGKMIFDGFYKKGKKLNIKPSKEMGKEEYWEEYDENDKLIRICQKDDYGDYKGFCYDYINDNLDRLTYFENGSETGYYGLFMLYDEPHQVWFEGYFSNGYREGRGKEYDRNGELISDGFYKKGKKLNIKPSKEMGKEEYWEEYDENDKLIRICQKDDYGVDNGMCYLYKDFKVRRISIWENGKEVTLLKQFRGDIMTEYHHGKIVYEGEFLDCLEYNYPRNGAGEELGEDGKTRIFKGQYKNGKRYGRGAVYKNGVVCDETDWIMDHRVNELWVVQSVIVISMLILMSISYLVPLDICFALLAVVLTTLLILWKYQDGLKTQVSPVFDFDFAVERFIRYFLVENNRDISSYSIAKELGRVIFHYKFVSIFAVWVIAFLVYCLKATHYSLYEGPHGISNEQESYIVGPGYGNSLRHFTISKNPKLKIIDIGNECFSSVRILRIEELSSLKSISIGSNSFTKKKNSFGNDESKSFHILNCESLKTIEIGEYSFSDFGGEFELMNLPQLQLIVIGNLNSNSYNFYSSSFIIQSILY